MDVKKLLGNKYQPDMTSDQIIKALESIEVVLKEEVDTNYVPKKTLDSAMTDAANWKKKYHETLSETERKAAEQAEQYEAMQAQLSEYQRSEALAKAENRFLALGYSDELAKSSAKAQVDGDNDALFANMKQHENEVKKSFIDSKQKQTSKPPTNNNTKTPADSEGNYSNPVEYCKNQILNAQQED